MADSKGIILNRMLSNISDEYDKTEGSFFHDAEAPVAIELAKLDAKAEGILSNGFADTATGIYLEKIVFEHGVVRKQATKAYGMVSITGVIGAKVPKGEKVASDNADFIFLDDAIIPASGSINVNVECELYGTIGNVPVNAIKYFPKTLEGLQTVTNNTAFTNGYSAESDESLRQRYYDKVRTPATSGNKYHYINWCKEVTGVGDVKVFPLWNGNGSVKCTIINENKRAADNTLVNDVFEYIEINRPIGATVTVVSATEKALNINVHLIINSSYTIEAVQVILVNSITEYLKNIAFKETYVSYPKIGSLILSTSGVLDYTDLTINDSIENITIADEEVAVLGAVTIV